MNPPLNKKIMFVSLLFILQIQNRRLRENDDNTVRANKKGDNSWVIIFLLPF